MSSANLGDCPWYLGTGTCSYDCVFEPLCETREPAGGWPNGPALPRPGMPRASELVRLIADALPPEVVQHRWDVAWTAYEALRAEVDR